MTKANDRRVKASLERTRLKLKAESLELEKQRRDRDREREETIVALRILCERYGSNEWPDSIPLAEIIERHLVEPMAATARKAIRQARAAGAAEAGAAGAAAVVAPEVAAAPKPSPPSPPRRPELIAMPPKIHRPLTVRAQAREGAMGYRVTCTCGWSGPIRPAETDADRDGLYHAQAGPARREARRS